jgi:hypothetical protein
VLRIETLDSQRILAGNRDVVEVGSGHSGLLRAGKR